MPDPVTNAYIARTTGPDFGSIATYQCYPGFTLQRNANVSCQSDNKWGSSPSCRGTCRLTVLTETLSIYSESINTLISK